MRWSSSLTKIILSCTVEPHEIADCSVFAQQYKKWFVKTIKWITVSVRDTNIGKMRYFRFAAGFILQCCNLNWCFNKSFLEKRRSRQEAQVNTRLNEFIWSAHVFMQAKSLLEIKNRKSFVKQKKLNFLVNYNGRKTVTMNTLLTFAWGIQKTRERKILLFGTGIYSNFGCRCLSDSVSSFTF